MSIAEFEALSAPVSAELPAGARIEYAEDVELEMLATRIPERAIGADNEPGARRLAAIEPDWLGVERRARALLLRSKDVRFIVLLVRALANQRGVEGLYDGLRVMRSVFERYWDVMHPSLGEMEARMNQVAGLFDIENLKLDLRDRPFVRVPSVGIVLVRDVESAVGTYPAREGVPALSEDQVRGAISALEVDEQTRIGEAVNGALDELAALSEWMGERSHASLQPDMQALTGILSALKQVLPQAAASTPFEGLAVDGPTVLGSLSTRGELMKRLDEVCEYLERNEPSNPAPLLIKRAKALIGKDFMQIIEDLAPGGMEQVRSVAGIRE